jgi:hypothetical protein
MHEHLSRLGFLSASALAATGALIPSAANAVSGGRAAPLFAAGVDSPAPLPPNPALGGISIQLPNVPGLGIDPATVYNFRGLVGRSITDGVGVNDDGTEMFWAADLGFASGEFISERGVRRTGAFFFC